MIPPLQQCGRFNGVSIDFCVGFIPTTVFSVAPYGLDIQLAF